MTIGKADFVLPRLNRGLFFDDFYGAVWTLYFARHADEAFFRSHSHGLFIVNFKDLHGANVDAGSAPVAFL